MHSFEVFKNRNDHNKWSKHIEYASKRSDLEEKTRSQLVESLTFLRNELGNGFLKSSPNHAIHQKITNWAPWQVQELISFTNTLKKLKNSTPSYEKVRSKLIPITKCNQEGIYFIEIVAPYLKNSFKVSFPEEIPFKKTPDIELQNINRDKIYIEVSKLDNSEETALLGENHSTIFNLFHYNTPFLPHSCIQLRPILKDEMPYIIEKIIEIKAKVISSGNLEKYCDDKIDLIVVPYEKGEILEEFCINNNREIGIQGLDLNLDETARIIKNKKLIKKAQQIPVGQTGLIYIPINPMYFIVANLETAISNIRQHIHSFPNILGVVLYSHMAGEMEDKMHVWGNSFYLRKTSHGSLIQDLLFIFNKSFNLPIQEETIFSIYKSLLA